MNDFDQLVADCIALKKGDTDFILRQDYPTGWRAGIGNPCPHVCLGESEPEIEVEVCATPTAAVAALKARLIELDGETPAPPDTRTPAERGFDEMMESLNDAEFMHIQDCLDDAYPPKPGEIRGRMIRTSMIVAAAITGTPIKALLDEAALIRASDATFAQ